MASEEVRIVHHEDRLPWLETVEPDEVGGSGFGRVPMVILAGLALLAAIVFGGWKMQHREAAADGALIAAQAGDYKVRPDSPGGLKVDGEGTTAVATSAGKSGNGAIDLNAVPEAPVDGSRVAPPSVADEGGKNTVASVPASGGRLAAKPPTVAGGAVTAGTGSGGSLVQLGAYPSEAIANASWTSFAKRFGYLASLDKSIQPVATGGKTLYRLRVNAGGAGQAADVCGRLRVAGETCFVAS